MSDNETTNRARVAHLMATYQYLADSGKTRQLSDLFLPDSEYIATIDSTERTFVGGEGVLSFFEAAKTAFLTSAILPARHHLSSIYIDVKPDGTVATYACFQFVGARGLDHWGWYRDAVVETEDGWRFARRHALVEGRVAESPVTKVF